MGGASLSESTIETVALGWLGAIGPTVPHGPAIPPDTPAERVDCGGVAPARPPAVRPRHDCRRTLVTVVTVAYPDADGRYRAGRSGACGTPFVYTLEA